MKSISDLSTPASSDSDLDQFFSKLRALEDERQVAAATARPALDRLARMMIHGTGQSYKVRALLWSLYNGKPTSLIEVLSLDWEVRKDLAAVILAFGHESLFYEAMRSAVKSAGLWAWFSGESEN